MSQRTARLPRSRWTLTAATVASTTAVAGLVCAIPAHAAQVTTVNCPTQNLRTTINDATPGSTLQVSGTCTGNFTITKNLMLIGIGGAVLDGCR
ncbi:hypothetical protein [Streptomyces sp. NPDC054783]